MEQLTSQTCGVGVSSPKTRTVILGGVGWDLACNQDLRGTLAHQYCPQFYPPVDHRYCRLHVIAWRVKARNDYGYVREKGIMPPSRPTAELGVLYHRPHPYGFSFMEKLLGQSSNICVIDRNVSGQTFDDKIESGPVSDYLAPALPHRTRKRPDVTD